MPFLMSIPLCPAELLALSGADAVAFAHAQFTNDVNALDVGAWQWNAWLDAQGRARAFFALLRTAPTELLAWLPLGGAAAVREALSRYVLRAAVKLEARTWTLHAATADELTEAPGERRFAALDEDRVLRLPGAPARFARLSPASADAFDADALTRWRRDDIAAGLPLLAPELAGEFVPQALDLERLSAIRFDKGCYPGQEIAARLHFRGGNKRRLHPARIEGAAPASGTALHDAQGSDVGRILYAANTIDATSVALAVVNEAAIAAAPIRTQQMEIVHIDTFTQT